MEQRTRHGRLSTGGALRGARFVAAAIALAFTACGAGDGGRNGSGESRTAEEPGEVHHEAARPEAARSENGAAEPAESAPATNGAAPEGADGAASSKENGARADGSAERRAVARMAMRPPPSPPPDPADPIADAPPPPPPPEAPELSPEEAIERACDPPVGREVESLTACGDVARAYQLLMERNRACRRDEDCRVLEGSCEVGLGGCWYAVHREVGYDDADALAARYRDLACNGPVCRCAPPPERARCRQGVCEAG